MASLQPDLPSLPQVLQLAALVPPTRAAPSALALLEPFLDLIRPPWLSSFLLTPDPIHLHHFLSPTFPARAFVSSTRTTRIEPPALPLPFDETHHCTSRTLHLPALSLPHLTLGFGALEILARSGPFWRAAPRPAPLCAACLPLRFIRDVRRNLLVELFDVGDVLMLYLTRYLSPTHTHVVTALCTRATFVAALASGRPSHILSALHFITSEHHSRTCHVCPPLPASPCVCLRAAAAPPAHPFDAPAFPRAMLPHLGLHFAVQDKLLFAIGRGRVRRHVLTGTRMLVQGAVDPLFARHIAAWAATSYLGATRRDPRSGMTPIISSHVLKFGDLFTLPPSMFLVAGRKPRAPGEPQLQVDDALNDYRVLQNLLDDEFKRQHDAAEVDATAEHSPGGALDLTLGHTTDSTALQDALSDLPPISSEYVYTVAPAAAATPEDEGLEDWWAERCEAGDRPPERTAPAGESELDASTLVGEELLSSELLSSELLSSELLRSSESNTSMSLFREEAEPVAARMEGVVDAETEAKAKAKAEAEAEEKLRARRLKARERREKNRLCAQRSNRRAKAVRDGLKADLRSCREKLEVLRAKEIALRQMNIELRRSFAEHAG